MALPAILAGVQLATSIYRGVKSAQGLVGMKGEDRGQFMDAAGPIQENKAIGDRMAKTGVDATTRAIAEQTQASQTAGQYRQFTDMSGGQLSSALGRIGAFNTSRLGQQIGAMNQSAIDRGLSMKMQANQQISGLQQADVRDKMSSYDRRQATFGQGVQDAVYSGVGALEGYATSKMSMENADADRQMYRDINGVSNTSQDAPSYDLGNPLSLYRKFGTPSQYKTGGIPAFSTGAMNPRQGLYSQPKPFNSKYF
jgi:hypothetical protein